MLINSANLMGGSSEPDGFRGFGRIHLEAGIPLEGMGFRALFVADSASVRLAEGAFHDYAFEIDSAEDVDEFRATLAWIDPPAASIASVQLVHDLDLYVTAPSGTRYTMWSDEADVTNVIERVVISVENFAAEESGTWTVSVSANMLTTDFQPYSLVVLGPFGTGTSSTTPPAQKPPSDSMPMITGVVSVVTCAILIALVVLLRRRRVSKQKAVQTPPAPPGHDDENLEQGGDQPHDDARLPVPAVWDVEVENCSSPSHRRNASPYPDMPGDADTTKSAPALLAEPVQLSTEHAKRTAADADDGDATILAVDNRNEKPPAYQDSASPNRHTLAEADAVFGGDIGPPSVPGLFDGAAAAEASSGRLVDEEDAAVGSANKSLTAISSIATASTNMSTAEQEEICQFRQGQRAADAAPDAGGPTPEGETPVGGGGGGTGASSSSAAASRQGSASDIGLRQAVLAAAQELARSCQIPGVSEAAGAVYIMANLYSDSHANDKASTLRLRQCRSMVVALKRADKVVGKVCRERAGLCSERLWMPRAYVGNYEQYLVLCQLFSLATFPS